MQVRGQDGKDPGLLPKPAPGLPLKPSPWIAPKTLPGIPRRSDGHSTSRASDPRTRLLVVQYATREPALGCLISERPPPRCQTQTSGSDSGLRSAERHPWGAFRCKGPRSGAPGQQNAQRPGGDLRAGPRGGCGRSGQAAACSPCLPRPDPILPDQGSGSVLQLPRSCQSLRGQIVVGAIRSRWIGPALVAGRRRYASQG